MDEVIYTVYVLYSFSYDKIYIGYTSNLIDRFRSHNKLGKKGWTLRYRPWVVGYTEVYRSKTEARKREKYLKSGTGRRFCRQQVEQVQPYFEQARR